MKRGFMLCNVRKSKQAFEVTKKVHELGLWLSHRAHVLAHEIDTMFAEEAPAQL